MNVRTVLVVDDEPQLRSLVGAVLRSQGYHTIEAQDGFQALQIATTTPVHLVLTDLVLPGMNGLQLINELRRLGCQTQYLLISGYLGSNVRLVDLFSFLPKPFTIENLLEAVQRAIDSGSGEPSSPVCSQPPTGVPAPQNPEIKSGGRFTRK